MIRCEAEGEGEAGMQAVASVIMNRVHVPYGEYLRTGQGDLRRVLQQFCQFTCYKTTVAGSPNPQNVWSMTPKQEHYRIADWALGGGTYPALTSLTLWYMNPFVPTCPNPFPYNGTGYWYTRIRQHCFYNPTAAYTRT
jgi:N-acetylmuramoyl-L-alanine amidase